MIIPLYLPLMLPPIYSGISFPEFACRNNNYYTITWINRVLVQWMRDDNISHLTLKNSHLCWEPTLWKCNCLSSPSEHSAVSLALCGSHSSLVLKFKERLFQVPLWYIYSLFYGEGKSEKLYIICRHLLAT